MVRWLSTKTGILGSLVPLSYNGMSQFPTTFHSRLPIDANFSDVQYAVNLWPCRSALIAADDLGRAQSRILPLRGHPHSK